MAQTDEPTPKIDSQNEAAQIKALQRRLAEAEATIDALLSGEIDAVVDRESGEPVLLAAAQQALQENERRFRAIFDGAMDAMLIADDDGRYLDANPAACELFGVAREALLDRTVADFAPPDFDFEQAWATFRHSDRERGEFRILRPDGSERVTEYAAVANFLPGQHLSVLRDVTARKRLEQERETARHKLEERVKETTLLLNVGRALSLAVAEPIPEVLAAIVQLLPTGWQYPQITAARITYGDDAFTTPDFTVTPWRQRVSFSVSEEKRITIEVVYLEERPPADEGPFLAEERQTLELLARLLKADVEHRQDEAALREREATFRYLFARNPQPMWVYERETGAILQVNDVAVARYGYSREEFLQMTIAEIRVPEPAAPAAGHVADRNHVTNERQHRLKDGRIIDVEVNSRPMNYKNRPAILKVAWDITARKQQEREMAAIASIAQNLRASPTRAEMLPPLLDEMMALFAADSVAVALQDTNSNAFTIERVHGQWQDLAGLRFRSGEGITGRVIASGRSFITDDLGAEPEYLGLGTMDQRYAAACIPLTADHHTVGALWLVREPVFTEADTRLMTAVSDIVANALLRARFYDQLQAQARQMEQVMMTVDAGLLLLDRERRVLLANPPALDYLPLLLDRPPDKDLIGTELTALGGVKADSFLAPAAIKETAVFHLTLDGTREREFALLAHIVNGESTGNGWVLVLREVTEERRAEEQRQQQDRLAAVGRLAAGIAHDFNNVMNTIGVYAQLLQKRSTTLSEKEQNYLRIINSQAHHAADLIHQILDFSRRSVMERGPLNLLPFLKELMKLWQRTLPENIELGLHYGKADYVVSADPSRLQQALMNLVINARDALPQGGELAFTLAHRTIAAGESPPAADMPPGDWCQLTVTDSGVGIAADDLPHIFDPFFTTKPSQKGTGLGLAQVHGIIKQHEGHILVDSQPGAGTTFTIFLPLMAETDAEESESPAALPLTEQPEGRTILVVEDDDRFREAVHRALEGLGHEVLAAENGRYALEQTTAYPGTIDLLISDLVMPELGGAELYRKMLQENPALRVIIMTGYPVSDDGRDLLQNSNVDRLQKPFTIEALAEKVQQILAAKDQ